MTDDGQAPADAVAQDVRTALSQPAQTWVKALIEEGKTAEQRPQNIGHGHVNQRPDGIKVRCGGPLLCPLCAVDAAQAR